MTRKDERLIATYPICNHGGIEILDFIYDINDYVSYRFNFGNTENKKIHKSQLYTNNKGTYFKANNMRIYLNDCIRV